MESNDLNNHPWTVALRKQHIAGFEAMVRFVKDESCPDALSKRITEISDHNANDQIIDDSKVIYFNELLLLVTDETEKEFSKYGESKKFIKLEKIEAYGCIQLSDKKLNATPSTLQDYIVLGGLAHWTDNQNPIVQLRRKEMISFRLKNDSKWRRKNLQNFTDGVWINGPEWKLSQRIIVEREKLGRN